MRKGKTDKLVVTPDVDSRGAGHSEVPPREGSRGARQEARRFGRARLDAGGRRHRLHRSQQDARRQAVHDDRASRRGDAGVHARGAELGPRKLRSLRHRSGLLPQARLARSRALGSDSEGRAIGGHRDGHGAGELAHRASRAAARGDDGRDFTLGHRAADRRREGKGARREAGRNPRGDSAFGERAERAGRPAAGDARRRCRSTSCGRSKQALEIALGKFEKPVRPITGGPHGENRPIAGPLH